MSLLGFPILKLSGHAPQWLKPDRQITHYASNIWLSDLVFIITARAPEKAILVSELDMEGAHVMEILKLMSHE